MNRIMVDLQVCSGKPVIKDTRIMVKTILGMVAGGYNKDQILKSYPSLTSDDVVAALEYAAKVVDECKVILHS